MDFGLEYKEREKNNMELVIDDLTVEVPEELVEERIYLMHIDRQEVYKMLLEQVKEYKECLLCNKKYDKNTFEQRFIAYLDGELAMYRQ